MHEGILAVIPQLYAFDPELSPKNWAFPGFVFTVAKRAMFAWARTQSAPVHVTQWAAKKITKAKRQAREEDRPIAELLEENGASPETVLILGDGAVRPTIDIDDAPCIPDEQDTQEDELISADLQSKLHQSLELLPRIQQRILRHTYGWSRTPQLPDTKIAKAVGIRVERVRELRDQALTTLRLCLGENP